MVSDSLSKITTQWSQIETLRKVEGPRALADFLAAKYFEALSSKFQKYLANIDDLKAHELASDALYELLKNDYRGIKRLERDRGRLRGLFFKIIKKIIIDNVYRKKKNDKLPDDFALESEEQWSKGIDIYLDVHEAIEEMKKARPLLYDACVYYYFEGQKITEICTKMNLTPTAVKQRLHSARIWLNNKLKMYDLSS